MPSWLNDVVVVSNVILAAALCVLLGSLRQISRTREWLARVVKTEGEIVGWSEGEDDSGITYQAVYRYAGIENRAIGGNVDLRTPPPLGERTVIFYDPSFPANAFLKESKAVWFVPGCTLFIGIGLIIGALMVRFGNPFE